MPTDRPRLQAMRSTATLWTRLRHEGVLLWVAVQFLTRVPVPPLRTWDDDWLNGCVRHFPVVGALVGAAGGVVLWAAAQVFTPLLAALLAVAVTAAVTGAFHEDGLADTLDALGGAVDRERALTIMKDSRIGTYGALALGLVTALRVGALAMLATADPAAAAVALAWVHAVARVAPVGVMAALPYGGDAQHAKAKPLATAVHGRQALMATAWGLLACGAAAPMLGAAPVAAAVAGVVAVAWAMTRWLRRRLGGYTGDGLGATEQFAEATALLTLAATLTP